MPRKATTCPGCNGPHRSDRTVVTDPLYTGPAGHAPDCACLECWADTWSQVLWAMEAEGDWTAPIEAIYLVSQGWTRQAASEEVGIHRNTLRRWIMKWRANPALIPDLLRERAEAMIRRGLADMK